MKKKFLYFTIFLLTFFFTLYLIIRITNSHKYVKVPNLKNMDVLSALEILGKNNLNLKIIDKRYNADVPCNSIISQKPNPYNLVKKNRSIFVIISLGKDLFQVPNCINKNIFLAKIEIKKSGFKEPSIAYVYSDKVQENTVIAQFPIADSLEKTNSINLLVSKGLKKTEYCMPDLKGYYLNNAKKVFEKMEVILAMIDYEKSDIIKKDCIINHFPEFGDKIKKGDIIKVVVSGEKEQKGSFDHCIVISYTVPAGLLKKHIKVILSNDDGEKKLINGLYSALQKIDIFVEIKGKTRLEIYVNHELDKNETREW